MKSLGTLRLLPKRKMSICDNKELSHNSNDHWYYCRKKKKKRKKEKHKDKDKDREDKELKQYEQKAEERYEIRRIQQAIILINIVKNDQLTSTSSSLSSLLLMIIILSLSKKASRSENKELKLKAKEKQKRFSFELIVTEEMLFVHCNKNAFKNNNNNYINNNYNNNDGKNKMKNNYSSKCLSHSFIYSLSLLLVVLLLMLLLVLYNHQKCHRVIENKQKIRKTKKMKKKLKRKKGRKKFFDLMKGPDEFTRFISNHIKYFSCYVTNSKQIIRLTANAEIENTRKLKMISISIVIFNLDDENDGEAVDTTAAGVAASGSIYCCMRITGYHKYINSSNNYKCNTATTITTTTIIIIIKIQIEINQKNFYENFSNSFRPINVDSHDHDVIYCPCQMKYNIELMQQLQLQLWQQHLKMTAAVTETITAAAHHTNVVALNPLAAAIIRVKQLTFNVMEFREVSFNRHNNRSTLLAIDRIIGNNGNTCRRHVELTKSRFIINKIRANIETKKSNSKTRSKVNDEMKSVLMVRWYWWWCWCRFWRVWYSFWKHFASFLMHACCYCWCWYRYCSRYSSPCFILSKERPTATATATFYPLKPFSFQTFFIIILGLHFLCLYSDTEGLRVTNSLTKSSMGNKEQLYIGLIAPHTNFGKREYLRAIHTAVAGLNKTRGAKLTFFKDYQFEPRNIRFDMMSLTPSPTAILSTLCKEFLQFNVSAILYMMNNEQFGHSTASAQYFLQLAGYLGIPVISWNADNSGLERRASQSTLQLQLAPSIEHQSAAMLSILERYKWHQFSVVTSQIAGHDDFVQAVRERVAEMQEHFKFTILNAIVVTRTSDLMELVNSEARVMLLYATQTEAITILRAAEDLKLTGENYVWVVSQSVIEKKDAHPQFPIGMLGVHFDTSSAALMSEISNAIKIYGYGVEAYVSDPANRGKKLNTQSLSCEDEGRGRWDNGETFFRFLRNVSIEGDLNKPNIEFTADGDLKSAELKIMNLRPSANSKNLVWEEIGVWKSWEAQKLDIRDIAWPGNSHAPPQGVPEKFHLKITFLEEAPYINLSPADPVSGKCLMDRGVLCRVAADHIMADIDVGQAHRNESFYQCCSGFCIDLLEKFAEELGFTYELVRVEDGRWGTLENGKWNGLIADLVNRKTDMVLTSLMINTEREAVVDFSEPFMETGIAIVVAKRTGIISPTAFLEPFDTASWMLVGIVAIQAATFMIFLFEWLSPSGYDMKLYLQNTNVTPYRFSLFRTYWLVWAVLFQAAVHVDSPRGFTSRFMTNVWALFAVVFLAIYTANLAAFMITREEFHEFSGLNDSRLVHPYSHKPSFKFGTIPYSHTDSTINKYFKEMHYYMKQHNKSSVADGVADVLSGNLDAFIYDGTVLDYLVAQDEDCRLMTVGSWYAMTGYGLAFSRYSKYVQMFNKRLLEFRANGDLERLRRYWMTGTCRPGKQEHKSSDPLALEQFLSAFLLLMAGILLAALLLLLEHVYFKYIRKRIAKKDGGHCCALISLSMGKSLTFRGAVFEATEILKKHRCNDPICDTHLWKVKHELDMTRLRVRQLEKALDKHGIKPPQLRLASSSDLLNHHHLKERPPLLGNLSLAASAQDLYRWSYTTEIAEMETVL